MCVTFAAALDMWGARRDYFERMCGPFAARHDAGCYDETSDLLPLNTSAPLVREQYNSAQSKSCSNNLTTLLNLYKSSIE